MENHRLRRNTAITTPNNNNNNNYNDSLLYDPTNPQFVLVVIQYETALDVKKLTYAVRSLRPAAGNNNTRLPLNEFDFRVASLEDNAQWTGYSHGAVTPFGMLRQAQIPIFLHQDVVPLHFFWMGGGHVQLKLKMAVTEFLKATKAHVADISIPRHGTQLMEDDD
jgi:prolyl-tRNA editing enzyme YbaK/EbsC (Cys-tRNA(Pro) deacylase)